MMVLSISLSARVGDSRRLWNKLGTQLGLLMKVLYYERSARKSDLLYGSSNLFLKVDETTVRDCYELYALLSLYDLLKVVNYVCSAFASYSFFSYFTEAISANMFPCPGSSVSLGLLNASLLKNILCFLSPPGL